jgi:hypothetical protein
MNLIRYWGHTIGQRDLQRTTRQQSNGCPVMKGITVSRPRANGAAIGTLVNQPRLPNLMLLNGI